MFIPSKFKVIRIVSLEEHLSDNSLCCSTVDNLISLVHSFG